MFKEYENNIYSKMLKKGYILRSATNDKVPSNNCASVTISFIVSAETTSISARQICEDLLKILLEEKVLYYSVIVSLLGDSCWSTESNIILPDSNNIFNKSDLN